MKTIQEALLLSSEFLSKKGITNPRREAEEILSEGLGLKRLDLYLSYDRPVMDIELEKCRVLLARRGKGEPIQYIRGSVDFFGCELLVTPSVLIPRQETEILVDLAAKFLKTQDLDGKILWDVCCGSGCIGLALKKKFPKLQVFLSDQSSSALSVAKENAEKNQLEVHFLEGDLLSPFQNQKCDFFVCNPPYISEDEFSTLQREVKDFEPKEALIAPNEGLGFYQRIATDLRNYINPKGRGWLEIGHQQGKAVNKIFTEAGWTHCNVEKDWAGHDRFFSLENE